MKHCSWHCNERKRYNSILWRPMGVHHNCSNHDAPSCTHLSKYCINASFTFLNVLLTQVSFIGMGAVQTIVNKAIVTKPSKRALAGLNSWHCKLYAKQDHSLQPCSYFRLRGQVTQMLLALVVGNIGLDIVLGASCKCWCIQRFFRSEFQDFLQALGYQCITTFYR